MEEKHYLHFDRIVKKRTQYKEVDSLNYIIPSQKLETLDFEAAKRRKKYMEFQDIDMARGLPFVRDLYQKLFSPVLFEEVYNPDSGSTFGSDRSATEYWRSERNVATICRPHLIFLMHGYMGAEDDLEKVHNIILQKLNNCRIHFIKCIANDKTHNIDEMGEMVADEMTFEIEKAKAEGMLTKITLIGHSLGGLIFRAALPYLRQYKHVFHTYISLATPHLGYFDSGNRLLSLGMWLVGGVKGTPALNEIRLIDAKTMEGTTLYKLSKAKGLNWFKKVMLLGSTQD